MTLPYLIDDCIYNILQYVPNDGSTLFNCLLVNRFWCKTTIPLLYADPFAINSKKIYMIISTLIFCFNKAEILQLKNLLRLKNQINNNNIDEEHKPLFEYLKYLEDYNYTKINSAIIGFINYSLGLSMISYEMYGDIIPLFHLSILRQSSNIKQLDISLHLFYKESFKNFNVQNFILTNLKSLSFSLNDTVNNEFEQEFLGNIANNSLNLRNLTIKLNQTQRSVRHNTSNNTTWDKLYKIIQGQNNLKIFKIWNCYSLLYIVLSSLEFQKNSLVHIEFINTDFNNVNLKSFNNLYNLEYLRFESCEGILLNQCEILNLASFKLKDLSFIRNKWNADVTSLMIKYLGESLQRLLVENPTNNLIENISMYCPYLIFLKIRICFNIDLSVFAFFKNLRTKLLNIDIYYNNDKFFIKLAKNIPINISKISIFFHHCDSVKFLKFKRFLEICHNSFKMINLNLIIELEFLKVILKYIKRSNNSLKILGMMKLDKELNDEELKLLNQIKAKGVEIVEFNSIHKFSK